MSIANSEKQKSKPHQRNSTFSTNVICDTKQEIKSIRKSNKSLKDEIDTEMQQNIKSGNDVEQKMQQLSEESASLAKLIEIESKKNRELKGLVFNYEQEINGNKMKLNKADGQAIPQLIKKEKQLEYKLEKARCRHNEALAQINLMKEDVNIARRERVIFSNVFKKLETDIKQSDEEFKKYLIIKMQKDEEKKTQEEELTQLKKKAHKDGMQFQSQYQSLLEQTQEEVKQQKQLQLNSSESLLKNVDLGKPENKKQGQENKDSLILKDSDQQKILENKKIPSKTSIKQQTQPQLDPIKVDQNNSNANNNTNSNNGSPSNKSNQIHNKNSIHAHKEGGSPIQERSNNPRRLMPQSTMIIKQNIDEVQSYEFILQKIAKQTGIDDPSLLVETYVNIEQENQNLFNEANKKNDRTVELQQIVSSLDKEIKSYEQQTEENARVKQEITSLQQEYKKKLQKQKKLDEENQQIQNEINQVNENLKKIGELINISYPTEPNGSNQLKFLKDIEMRIDDIINMEMYCQKVTKNIEKNVKKIDSSSDEESQQIQSQDKDIADYIDNIDKQKESIKILTPQEFREAYTQDKSHLSNKKIKTIQSQQKQ